MTFMARLSAILFVFGGIGCGSIQAGASADSGANRCDTEEDCKSGRCDDGTCVAVESALERVAVEIIAPAAVSAGEYQQMRYLRTIELSSDGRLDFSLDYVAELAVRMTAPAADCAYVNGVLDGSRVVAVEVEAEQSPGINGIASSRHPGVSVADGADHSATLRLPPGKTDLYVVPLAEDGNIGASEDCALVPYLARGQTIEAGNVLLKQAWPRPRRLSVDVAVPVGAGGTSPFEGFVVDLVEPTGGRRLSNRVKLAGASVDEGVAHHRIDLFYLPPVGEGAADESGRELFRFTPPSSAVAPVFYVAKVAADLFGNGQVSIDQVKQVPKVVRLSGTILSEESRVSVTSQVTAVLRNGENSANSAILQHTASATTDEAGQFELELVEGTYDFVATPLSETRYASRVGVWTVSADDVASSDVKVSLPALSSLTGRVVGSQEELGQWSADVVAVPSTIGQPRTFIDLLLGNGRILGRRSEAVALEVDGSFELGVDPGNYDVFVRPVPESGYPWAVRPNTVVAEGPVGLGAVELSVPFIFSGQVRIPGVSAQGEPLVLPGALIRAYALYGADGRLVGELNDATSAVQIAEARADSVGGYELRLPASLN